MSRPISATIHLDALRHNLGVVRHCAPQSRVLAVLKANGYGHGLLASANGLQAADGFAVLGIDEAVALREAGYRQTILLLEGVFQADELPLASHLQLSLVVHCAEQLLMLEAARDLAPVEVFLKINTGMNRLGVPPGRFWSFYDRLRACKTVSRLNLMTHFATADEVAGVSEQLERFECLTGEINAPRSLANSAAILRHPHTHADWVRPGIMLYGASPFAGETAAQLGLQPAMTLNSAIIGVQALQPGDAVGYGRKFIAERSTRIGVVACGYADGYPRHAPTGTPVAVAGKLTRTLGRVSMDMLFADLTDIPEADVGSPVELWGTQVPVDAVAAAADTIGYELLCAVTRRVPMREG